MSTFTKASNLVSPYENIVIGNFLYGLGLAIGRRAVGKPSIANVSLTQQTPLDPQMGDVMVRFPGVVRLIEFKRASSTSKKETKEERKLKQLQVALSRDAHLQKVSLAIHWYVKSMPTAADRDLPIRVCPYLEMQSGGHVRTLADFSNELATLALAPATVEPDDTLIKEYFDCLARMAGAGSATGGGIIVCVSADGVVNYVALSDLRQLGMDPGKFLQLQHELARDIAMAQEQEQEQERRLTRTRGLQQSTEWDR